MGVRETDLRSPFAQSISMLTVLGTVPAWNERIEGHPPPARRCEPLNRPAPSPPRSSDGPQPRSRCIRGFASPPWFQNTIRWSSDIA